MNDDFDVDAYVSQGLSDDTLIRTINTLLLMDLDKRGLARLSASKDELIKRRKQRCKLYIPIGLIASVALIAILWCCAFGARVSSALNAVGMPGSLSAGIAGVLLGCVGSLPFGCALASIMKLVRLEDSAEAKILEASILNSSLDEIEEDEELHTSGDVEDEPYESNDDDDESDAIPDDEDEEFADENEDEEPCLGVDVQLSSLVGLESVKQEVRELQAFVKLQMARKRKGLPNSSPSYHCVFTGNPGTGKTTVARIIAQMYKELGVVKKGQLVETDRQGLIGEYVGQTAPKVDAVVRKALDGVLFIDEAYSLANGTQNDFGPEAIATLLKRMEDYRDRLVVIVAGYTKEMQDFIKSNPGLQSRFARTIHFPDYSDSEMVEIFIRMASKYGYLCSTEVKDMLASIIGRLRQSEGKDFGNGRSVRKFFEQVERHIATRLSGSKYSMKDMQTILPEDLKES